MLWKFLKWFSISVLVFTMICVANASESFEAEQSEGLNESEIQAVLKEMEAEQAAINQYKNVLALLEKSDAWDALYGGAWCNEENRLVVLLTDPSESVLTDFYDAIGSQEIEVRKAEYPLSALKSQMEACNDAIACIRKCEETPELSELAADISYLAVDEKQNRITVGIQNLNSGKIEEFRNRISDSPMLQFAECPAFAPSSAAPGQRLQYTGSVNSTYFSLGLKAYRATSAGIEYGFVTAGHVYVYNSAVYQANASSSGSSWSFTYLGRFRAAAYYDGGSSDLSFVGTASGVSISNTTYYGSKTLTSNVQTISGAESNLTGITLFKAGARTGLTSGTVNSVCNFIYTDGMTIRNTIMSMTLVNDGGDSGGPVFRTVNGTNYVVATVGGRTTGIDGAFLEGYYPNIVYGLNGLGCSLY